MQLSQTNSGKISETFKLMTRNDTKETEGSLVSVNFGTLYPVIECPEEGEESGTFSWPSADEGNRVHVIVVRESDGLRSRIDGSHSECHINLLKVCEVFNSRFSLHFPIQRMFLETAKVLPTCSSPDFLAFEYTEAIRPVHSLVVLLNEPYMASFCGTTSYL